MGSGTLDGRVIAIAGAGGGLGPLVAAKLAEEGASLALTDVKQESLDAVVTGLGLPEERVDAQVVDLLDSASADKWAQDLEARFGHVDGLMHLVGGWRGGEPIETTSLEDYDFLHKLLVLTVQRTSRAFHGPLIRSGNGRFVLISSAQAQNPQQGNASYAATKAAAESWTLALADCVRGERLRRDRKHRRHQRDRDAEDARGQPGQGLQDDDAGRAHRRRLRLPLLRLGVAHEREAPAALPVSRRLPSTMAGR